MPGQCFQRAAVHMDATSPPDHCRMSTPGRGRGIGRIVRTILIGLAALGFCLVGVGLIVNNRPHAQPTPAELQGALNRALDWVSTHDAEVLRDSNPALWWMLATADERLGGDARLAPVLRQYQQRWLMGSMSTSLWKRMFDRHRVDAFVSAEDITTLPPYVRLFAYGLTCDKQIAADPDVRSQFSSDFCPNVWLFSPRCSTHQLMGMLWSLQASCDGVTGSEATTVLTQIRRELTFDFRVDDSYVQRVLLIAASSTDPRALKPVWIARVLDRQLADGGWDSSDPMFHVSPSRALLMGARGISIRKPAADFHTTAQGILLLAYLLKPDAPTAPTTPLAHWPRLPPA